MLWGSHAERVATPSIITWVVPDGLDIVEAACVPVAFGTADDCLFEFGHLQPGETVLVQAGASGVGLAAIQLAKRAGATVLATASSDEKLERLREYGLDHGINYRTSDFAGGRPRADRRARRQPRGRLGRRSTLAGSVQALAYRGRITLVGNAGRDPQPFDASMLMMGNQTLTGVFLGAEITTDRVRADDRPPPRGHRRRQSAASWSTGRSRSPTPPAPTPTLESRQAFGRVVLIP